MQKPKEDEAAKKARERERRISMLERRDAAEDQSYGATNDIRAVYGLQPASKRPAGTRRKAMSLSGLVPANPGEI
jgi:hypothetical protein